MIPEVYVPPDSAASLWIGASLFTANNDGATGIGLIYTPEGTTAPGGLALNALGEEALGCVDANPDPATDIANDLTGKIALVRRGVCSFVYKVVNAIAAGAVGVILYNGDDRVGPADTIGNMIAPDGFTTQMDVPVILLPNGIAQPVVDAFLLEGDLTLTIRAFQGSVSNEDGARPATAGIELRGANPFAGQTSFRVFTAQPQTVRVVVYNARGQQVQTLFDGGVADQALIPMNAGSLPSGVYFVRAMGETFQAQTQVTVIR